MCMCGCVCVHVCVCACICTYVLCFSMVLFCTFTLTSSHIQTPMYYLMCYSPCTLCTFRVVHDICRSTYSTSMSTSMNHCVYSQVRADSRVYVRTCDGSTNFSLYICMCLCELYYCIHIQCILCPTPAYTYVVTPYTCI